MVEFSKAADIKAKTIAKQKMPWCRYYSSALGSKSIRLAAKEANISYPLALGYFMGLLGLASESGLRGYVLVDDESAGIEYLVDLLDGKLEELAPFMDGLLKYHALSRDDSTEGTGALYFENWDRYQFESDNSAERTRKYRKQLAVRKGIPTSESTDGEPQQDEDPERELELEKEKEEYSDPYHTACHGDVTVTSQNETAQEDISSSSGANAQGRKLSTHLMFYASYQYRAHVPATEELRKQLVDAIPEPTRRDLDKFRLTVEYWCKENKNPTDVAGIMDWYKRGIPHVLFVIDNISGEPTPKVATDWKQLAGLDPDRHPTPAYGDHRKSTGYNPPEGREIT